MGAVRRALIIAGWFLAATLALVSSAVYHAQLPVAHRIVRDAVNAFVTGEIRGELAIGRLDKVTLDHVVARWVSLYDGEGRRVIVAERIDLFPEFGELRGNVLRFKVSKLDRAVIRMVDGGEGVPSWITGLEPKLAGPPSLNPLRALLDRIEASNVTVYGDYLGLENFRVENLDAVGRLDINREVQVAIERATGTFVQPFPFPGLVDSVTGTIDTTPTRGVDLKVECRRERTEPAASGGSTNPDDERVSAQVTYKSPSDTAPQELRISVQTAEVTPDSLRGLGYDWIGPIEPPLKGTVELFGPPTQLAIEAAVESAAGDARASGTISEAQGISVHIASDAIEVDKLVSDGPEVTVKGKFHVSAPPAPSEAPPRIHVELAQTRYKGFLVPAFELDGIIQESRLFIERARSNQGGRLSIRGAIGFDGGTDLRVEANLPAIHRDPNMSRYVEDLEGQLTAAVRVQIPAGARAIALDGKVELADVRYASLRAARVIVQGTARGDPQLPQVDVQVRGEEVHVLDYRVGVASFALKGGPRQYLAQGEFSPSEGQKTFYFDADIAASRKQFVIQADPIEFVVGDKTFRGAARDVTINAGDSVSLGMLRLASGPQRLEATGIVRTRGADELTADLQNFDLAALHALIGDRFPLKQGNADARVEMRGDVAKPELLIQGAMRGGHVLDVPNVDAMYFVTYNDGLLEFDNQIEVAGRGSIHLNGQGKLDGKLLSDPRRTLEDGHYDLELSSTDFDLMLLPQLRDRVHQGRVSGSVKISGSLDAPTIHGQLSAAGLGLTGMRPVDWRGEFDYDGARINATLELADRGGPLANLTGETSLAWARLREAPRDALGELPASSWKMRGSLQARPLGSLPVDVPESLRWPFSVSSRFTFEREPGNTRGSMRVVARGLEQLADETCKLNASSEWEAELALEGERITATYQGMLAGKRVFDGEARLEVPVETWLAGTGPFRIARADLKARAAFDDIEGVPVLCRHGHGDLHADIRVDGLFTPQQRAQIDLIGSLNPHVRVLEGRQRRVVESCLDDPARVWMQVKLDAKQASAQGWLEGCYGGHTDLGVTIPLAWSALGAPGIDGDRETRVQLDFAESQLRPLLDRLPGVLGFGAMANGRLVATGNKKRVAFSGAVKLTEGKLYLLSTGQELKDIRVALTGNGNWVKVDGLRASTSEGRPAIQATGGIGFDRWRPSRAQLGLVLRAFPVQREGIELASLNGSAALSTEIGPEVAQTAVKLHEMAIRLPSSNSSSTASAD
jgi:hypothetical protein